eukprot:9469487-Pyramimonas_sp.AAC.1
MHILLRHPSLSVTSPSSSRVSFDLSRPAAPRQGGALGAPDGAPGAVERAPPGPLRERRASRSAQEG